MLFAEKQEQKQINEKQVQENTGFPELASRPPDSAAYYPGFEECFTPVSSTCTSTG